MSGKLKVAAAAVLHDGKVYTLPPPARHHTILHMMYEQGIRQDATTEQGFVLSDGDFCTRKAAYIVAEMAGQILRHTSNGDQTVLYSEDLW